MGSNKLTEAEETCLEDSGVIFVWLKYQVCFFSQSSWLSPVPEQEVSLFSSAVEGGRPWWSEIKGDFLLDLFTLANNRSKV